MLILISTAESPSDAVEEREPGRIVGGKKKIMQMELKH